EHGQVLRGGGQGQGDAEVPRTRDGAPGARHGSAEPRARRSRRARQGRAGAADGRPPDDDGVVTEVGGHRNRRVLNYAAARGGTGALPDQSATRVTVAATGGTCHR